LKKLLATNDMGKLNMANLDKNLVNFWDAPLPPFKSCGAFATLVFLLQNGEFMTKKKHYCQVAKFR
jgi:hypothetical protein